MALWHKVQLSKYDIKRLVVKHKLELKSHRYMGRIKKGYRLFKQYEYQANNNEEAPF